ncbi:hypothetical protein BDN67DRAFT_1017155 [Paxillus ammoniavirescens]|nr:hypothetical protein BDN67DRAFT_1017155 [Paxillus ammoniavirescens]
MHCILEGLVQHHVRSLLGLTTQNALASQASQPAFHHTFIHLDPDAAAAQSMTTKEISQVSTIQDLLHFPHDHDLVEVTMEKLQDSLFHKNMRPLKFMYYAKALIQWCRQMPPAIMEGRRKYNMQEVLKRIHNIICNTSKPLWFGSVPSNFGEVSAGTIKADEWCSLITVYIPIALISLWGYPPLDVTLKLVLDDELQTRQCLLFMYPCAWLSRPECLPTIQECQTLLDQAYGMKGDTQNTADNPLEDNIHPPKLPE